MNKLQAGILGGMFLTLVGCSSQKQEDFHGAAWGVTKEQAIAIEEKKGNTVFEEDADDPDELSIEFEDISVDGYKADAEFVFKNEIAVDPLQYLDDSKYAALREELMDSDTSEERMAEVRDELDTYYDENQEKIESMPSEASFDDFRLLAGNYYFSEMDEADSANLLVSLTKKYGKPRQEKSASDDSVYYMWFTERSSITFDGDNYVAYYTSYEAVKKYAKVNGSKSDSSDL